MQREPIWRNSASLPGWACKTSSRWSRGLWRLIRGELDAILARPRYQHGKTAGDEEALMACFVWTLL
jgi:hypothetical protein